MPTQPRASARISHLLGRSELFFLCRTRAPLLTHSAHPTKTMRSTLTRPTAPGGAVAGGRSPAKAARPVVAAAAADGR